MQKTISELISIDQLVGIGDDIHNAHEIMLLTHSFDADKDNHHVSCAIVGDKTNLIHLVAKQFCENEEFFTIIMGALDKLGLKIDTNIAN